MVLKIRCKTGTRCVIRVNIQNVNAIDANVGLRGFASNPNFNKIEQKLSLNLFLSSS